MELFFYENLSENSPEITLPPEEGHHCLHVMRKRTGERIHLTDGNGRRAAATIQSVKGNRVTCRIIRIDTVPPPRSRAVQAALSPIRPRRMDWAVEKLTELGVGEIIPVLCENSAIRRIKQSHLKKIAVSALKQSRQFYLPQIMEPVLYSEWLSTRETDLDELLLIGHPAPPAENKPANGFHKGTILIGPEGGFTETELKLAESHHFRPVRLSHSILRTETAVVAGAFLLSSLFNGTDTIP